MTGTKPHGSAAPDILSMTRDELRDYIVSLGEARYRADQLYSWMMRGAGFDEMTNLPKAFRALVAERADYRRCTVAARFESSLDETVKYAFELEDGECVESVFMKYEHGTTVCVSSQAGCAMGCRFCASTIGGRVRNLTPSEILGQVIAAGHDRGERIDGVVMMGIGEPLDNYESTVKFLRLVSSEEGLNIGLRHISVSTCGIVPGIVRLADEGMPVTLSVSLHAHSDEKRSEIMPVNRRYPIAELMEACRYYFGKTGRRISFEYTLISGKNDSTADARALAALLRREIGPIVHVNLIMLNEVRETGLSAPERESARVLRGAEAARGQRDDTPPPRLGYKRFLRAAETEHEGKLSFPPARRQAVIAPKRRTQLGLRPCRACAEKAARRRCRKGSAEAQSG